MAKMRAIRPEIFEDDFIGSLDYFHRWLWIGLFAAVADDQGRFWLNPLKIRAQLFSHPKDSQVTDKMVTEGIELFDRNGKLQIYRKDGKTICQIVSWWKHQKPRWAMPSEYPPPSKWMDRERYHSNKKVTTVNWELPGGFSREKPTNETNGSPAHHMYADNVGTVTPFIDEALNQAVSKYTQEWVVKAIEISIKNNVQRLSYILAILENWQDAGGVDFQKKNIHKDYLGDEYAEFIED